MDRYTFGIPMSDIIFKKSKINNKIKIKFNTINFKNFFKEIKKTSAYFRPWA